MSNTQQVNYECLRGHVTSVKASTKASLAIRCTCVREDGKVCKETAYYQPTDADRREAASIEAVRPIDYDFLDSLHADENPY